MWKRITAIMLSFWMSVNPVYEAGMMKIIAEASPIARSEDDETIDIAKPENISDTDDSDPQDTEPQSTETPSTDPENPEPDYPEPSTEPTPVPTEPALPELVTPAPVSPAPVSPEPVSPEPVTPEPSAEPAAPEWAQMFYTYSLDYAQEEKYRKLVTSELYNADEKGKFQTEIVFKCRFDLKEEYTLPENVQVPDIEVPIALDDQYIARPDGSLWLYEFYNDEYHRIEVKSTPTDDVNIFSISFNAKPFRHYMLVNRYAVVAENTDPSPTPSVSPSADPQASPSASPESTASPKPTETPKTSAEPSASPDVTASPEPSAEPDDSETDENKFEYRLIVSGKHFAIREGDTVISHYEDVYLFGFHTFKELEEGRVYYSETAGFAERDATVTVADPEYVKESSEETEDEEIGTEQQGTDVSEIPSETPAAADTDVSDTEPTVPESTPDTKDPAEPADDIKDDQNVTTENNPLDQLSNEFEINPKVEKEELPEDAARPQTSDFGFILNPKHSPQSS